jgi:subtilisin family serine protease
VTVGVIDTGIAADHPDLVGKLRPVNGWFDPYGDTPSPSDWDGHGTHVSGTIVGGNASGTYIGVAPQATLIVAQLFNEDGQATEDAALACMQWMMTQMVTQTQTTAPMSLTIHGGIHLIHPSCMNL